MTSKFRSGRQVMAASLVVAAMCLSACGGGGGGGESPPPDAGGPPPKLIQGSSLPADAGWQPPAGATPASGNYVYLSSESGDPVGNGETRVYTDAESTLRFDNAYGKAWLYVAHPQRQWEGELVFDSTPQVGFYTDVMHPLQLAAPRPGQRWSTEWRECDQPDGWFAFDRVVMEAGIAMEVEMRFVQRCRAGGAALRGKLRWSRAEARMQPLATPPAPLWQPPAGAVPATGSYLYLESSGDDPVGQGQTLRLTPADGTMMMNFIDDFGGQGYGFQGYGKGQYWWARLNGHGEVRLRPGYYPGVQAPDEAPFNAGTMAWGSGSASCSRVSGWMFVEHVEYFEDWPIALEMRFEQRCDRRDGVLRGKLKWSIFDALPPLGPEAIPAGVWQAPPGALPAQGDFVYLESDAGDPVGQGQTRLYAGADANLAGTPGAGGFHMRAGGGDTAMAGSFTPMIGVGAPTVGLYTALPRLTEPVLGGLDWRIGGFACDQAESWMAIDAVNTAEDGSVASLEWRFEQRCAGAAGSLRGQGRWTAPASGVVVLAPAPVALWKAPAERLPAGGNYLYLESDVFEGIGGGFVGVIAGSGDRLDLYADDGAPGLAPASLSVVAWSHPYRWEGRLELPEALSAFVPGLYGNLSSRSAAPHHARAHWSGKAWSCAHDGTGWFVVDHVEFAGGVLLAVDLRFEQLCMDGPGTLRGQLRWRAADVPAPPDAVPVPADLWQPPAGRVPPTGNVLYLESEYGDAILRGETQLLTEAEMTASVGIESASSFYVHLDDRATRRRAWTGQFARPARDAPLTVGYYAGARSHDPNNPGPTLSFERNGFHCNTQSGWFVVDEIETSGADLVAVDLRFETRCNNKSGRLRGRLRWRF